MINNDVLRSIRYILNISEFKLVEIVKLGGGEVSQATINSYLKREEEPGFEECDQKIMSQFLNGLIYFKRGRDENRPALQEELPTNNVVFKKLRVAFELKDDDILKILSDAEFNVSKTELSAFFRKEGHHNYREVGDQFLRNFLKGLSNKFRSQT